MKAIRFRVQNFRNIDDSDWIALEKVTAFVGRNESGKTSLLKALHKFNSATPEPYDPQREFHATATREITLLMDRKAETGPFARLSLRFQRNFGLKLANYLRKTENLPRRSLRPATTMAPSS